mmetsp:Transcript_28122/g.71050  ORF Transcript_28122/g.71050 Transcript_28122/m.71050 type:complete len:375 (+) Transcript_28122:116-1240(+)
MYTDPSRIFGHQGITRRKPPSPQHGARSATHAVLLEVQPIVLAESGCGRPSCVRRVQEELRGSLRVSDVREVMRVDVLLHAGTLHGERREDIPQPLNFRFHVVLVLVNNNLFRNLSIDCAFGQEVLHLQRWCGSVEQAPGWLDLHRLRGVGLLLLLAVRRRGALCPRCCLTTAAATAAATARSDARRMLQHRHRCLVCTQVCRTVREAALISVAALALLVPDAQRLLVEHVCRAQLLLAVSEGALGVLAPPSLHEDRTKPCLAEVRSPLQLRIGVCECALGAVLAHTPHVVHAELRLVQLVLEARAALTFLLPRSGAFGLGPLLRSGAAIGSHRDVANGSETKNFKRCGSCGSRPQDAQDTRKIKLIKLLESTA